MMRNDDKIADIYHQNNQTNLSPCAIHDGNKTRTDCIVCKKIVEDEELPIVISKAFLAKLNVTENLLKFLAIQQDKRKAAENK